MLGLIGKKVGMTDSKVEVRDVRAYRQKSWNDTGV